MWESMDDLLAAIQGDYGSEEQEAALEFAEESGLADQWIADEDAEAAGNYDDALEEEFQRLEQVAGRELTPDEEQAMIDAIPTQDRDEGAVPDLVSAYGQQVASARESEDGRLHLGASAAQEVFDQQDDQGRQRQMAQEPPEPAGGDYDLDDYEDDE